jgi:hypothetical protein
LSTNLSDEAAQFCAMQPVPYVWKGDEQAWGQIFAEMGLKLDDERAKL